MSAKGTMNQRPSRRGKPHRIHASIDTRSPLCKISNRQRRGGITLTGDPKCVTCGICRHILRKRHGVPLDLIYGPTKVHLATTTGTACRIENARPLRPIQATDDYHAVTCLNCTRLTASQRLDDAWRKAVDE